MAIADYKQNMPLTMATLSLIHHRIGWKAEAPGALQGAEKKVKVARGRSRWNQFLLLVCFSCSVLYPGESFVTFS